jgi:hypothetical protein
MLTTFSHSKISYFYRGVQWKLVLICLAVCRLAFVTYLNYRQYCVLSRSSSPKVLRDIITREEFHSKQAQGRAALLYEAASELYQFLAIFCILYLRILPKLWEVTGFQPDLVLPNWLEGPIYDFISYETGHCLMFFAASSLG